MRYLLKCLKKEKKRKKISIKMKVSNPKDLLSLPSKISIFNMRCLITPLHVWCFYVYIYAQFLLANVEACETIGHTNKKIFGNDITCYDVSI